MKLPAYARASALVAALSIAAVVIITVAEIGHPPSDGVGLVASLVLPARANASPASSEPLSGADSRVALETTGR